MRFVCVACFLFAEMCKLKKAVPLLFNGKYFFMKKILFIQPALLHYRVDFYRLLQQELDCEIHIVHSGNKINYSLPSNVFSHHIFHSSFFGFKWVSLGKVNFNYNDFDKVILPLDISWLNSFFARIQVDSKLRIVYWGIGTGKRALTTRLRIFLRKNTPTILYNFSALKYFSNYCEDVNNLFVCSNTIDVNTSELSFDYSKKKNLLFVGSLHCRKKLEDAILAFKLILPFLDENAVFNIVGDGNSRNLLERYVSKLWLDERVMFHGAVTDEVQLKNLYSSSFCNVSPGQCGLSALQSIANGVPFVTYNDAVTGGEISAVLPRKTGGIVAENISALAAEILFFSQQSEFNSREIFNSCLEHYTCNFPMENMVKVFKNVLNGC